MSDSRIYVHVVWGVKDRYPLLEETQRQQLLKHIIKNANEKRILILAINGHLDHLHCLLRLGSSQSIAQVMQLIKGESSHWANTLLLFEKPLIWAKSYYARSVDEVNLHIVKLYIQNQQKHQYKKI